MAQNNLDWWRVARGYGCRVASVSLAWLHRRSLGCSADDQRVLRWTLPWGREHGEGQVQIALSFRSPLAQAASGTSYGAVAGKRSYEGHREGGKK